MAQKLRLKLSTDIPNREELVNEGTDFTYRALSPRPAFSVTVQYSSAGRKKPMSYSLSNEDLDGLLKLE